MIIILNGTEYGGRYGYGAGGTESVDFGDGQNGVIVVELDETYVSDHTTRPIVITTTTPTTDTSTMNTMSTTSKSSIKMIETKILCFLLLLHVFQRILTFY